jgi:hypothetical protein
VWLLSTDADYPTRQWNRKMRVSWPRFHDHSRGGGR